MTPYGVLWDLDGTLVDTGEFHYQSWNETLAEHGLALSREQFAQVFGMNNGQVLRTLLGWAPEPGLLAQIDAEKEERFRAAIRGRAQALPGALTWLERLRRAGARQAIASSAPAENVDALVDELGLRDYFQGLVSGAGLPSKPDPAIFLTAAERLGLTPGRCVVVEDSPAGVGGARRAGIRCVAVTQTHPAEDLTGADRIVSSLEELPEGAFEALLEGN